MREEIRQNYVLLNSKFPELLQALFEGRYNFEISFLLSFRLDLGEIYQ